MRKLLKCLKSSELEIKRKTAQNLPRKEIFKQIKQTYCILKEIFFVLESPDNLKISSTIYTRIHKTLEHCITRSFWEPIQNDQNANENITAEERETTVREFFEGSQNGVFVQEANRGVFIREKPNYFDNSELLKDLLDEISKKIERVRKATYRFGQRSCRFSKKFC